jgi:lipopolysaccharide export system protein LptA
MKLSFAQAIHFMGITVLFVTLPAFAAPDDRSQPLYLDAGQCVFDVRKNESRCQKGMNIRQGSLQIAADKGTVFRQKKRIIRIELEGAPAVFRQQLSVEDGELVAKALYMDYQKAREVLVLKGNVIVKSPNLGTFTGDEMIINLKTQEITGGQGKADQRVHLVLEGEPAEALKQKGPDDVAVGNLDENSREVPDKTAEQSKDNTSPVNQRPQETKAGQSGQTSDSKKQTADSADD